MSDVTEDFPIDDGNPFDIPVETDYQDTSRLRTVVDGRVR